MSRIDALRIAPYTETSSSVRDALAFRARYHMCDRRAK
jgi:hypothetical protein